MTFGWYQLKLLGALLGIFEFKFLFWRQSSNVTGRFIQVVNSNRNLRVYSRRPRSNILLTETFQRSMTFTNRIIMKITVWLIPTYDNVLTIVY
jgi:hypothetical protein